MQNSGRQPFFTENPGAARESRWIWHWRGRVESMLAEMQALYERGHTPKATPSKGCSACSLKEICLPKLIKTPAASTYLQAHLSDAEESI